ncbi:heme-degrading domain-containing protein [Rhodococcus sp. NPDC056960]|uniref:heme-degrading domain-containing protein n=1 Tax=Rhodococcus sp. NPDC056960 TaxID=3345982 RepID=UPI00363E4C75
MIKNTIQSETQWKLIHANVMAEVDGLSFERFGYDDAWAVGGRLMDISRERHHPVAIAVVFGEQRVFHAALPGSSANNDDWLDRKFRVVRRHNAASYAIGCAQRAVGGDYYADNGYDRSKFAVAGGAVPLRVQGSLVGAVGVSGLAEEEDHALVVEVLREHRGR